MKDINKTPSLLNGHDLSAVSVVYGLVEYFMFSQMKHYFFYHHSLNSDSISHIEYTAEGVCMITYFHTSGIMK